MLQHLVSFNSREFPRWMELLLRPSSSPFHYRFSCTKKKRGKKLTIFDSFGQKQESPSFPLPSSTGNRFANCGIYSLRRTNAAPPAATIPRPSLKAAKTTSLHLACSSFSPRRFAEHWPTSLQYQSADAEFQQRRASDEWWRDRVSSPRLANHESTIGWLIPSLHHPLDANTGRRKRRSSTGEVTLVQTIEERWSWRRLLH